IGEKREASGFAGDGREVDDGTARRRGPVAELRDLAAFEVAPRRVGGDRRDGSEPAEVGDTDTVLTRRDPEVIAVARDVARGQEAASRRRDALVPAEVGVVRASDREIVRVVETDARRTPAHVHRDFEDAE